MSVIKNAEVEGLSITNADHGWLSIWLYLDYGDSSHQGFGGYALYNESKKRKEENCDYAGAWIWGILKVCGVDNWDKIKGKTIRVQKTHDGFDSSIERIGHITKDIWFNPEEIK